MLVVLLAAFAAPEAHAVDLNPGDILLVDGTALEGALFHIDPVSGTQTVVSSGGAFETPKDVAIGANGDVLVLDTNAKALFHIDPVTGAQTVVSSGGVFSGAQGMAIERSGNVVVSSFPLALIIRVDPVIGTQAAVSFGGFLRNPIGIAIESSGNIVVANRDQSAFTGNIVRVDAATGHQTLLSSGFLAPFDVAVDANDDILVVDPGSDRIIRVDPVTGAQTIVSSVEPFVSPVAIAIEATGGLLVVDGAPLRSGIVRVNPITGEQTRLPIGGSLIFPQGITVVPGMAIEIDIKPGSDPNPINPSSHGVLPVAILGSAEFEASEVDGSTLAFGPGASALAHANGPHFQDLNEDGLVDLLAHFRMQETGIEPGDTEACVTGETVGGVLVEGCDAIRTVGGGGCGLGLELPLLLPSLMWLRRWRRHRIG